MLRGFNLANKRLYSFLKIGLRIPSTWLSTSLAPITVRKEEEE
jgi:hypothetical protein